MKIMLSNAQEKLIRSLHTKKGREKTGLCLVEGEKVIEAAGDAVDFVFTPEDTENFSELVTTQTPQEKAAVARIPEWTEQDVLTHTVLILDGVQDPGNIGSIFRLCHGFQATLVLVESVDPFNPKVVRSSVGAVFQVPFLRMNREEAQQWLQDTQRPIFSLELSPEAQTLQEIQFPNEPIMIIAGSEGQGVKLDISRNLLYINHEQALESLNVTHAVALTLYKRYTQV